MKRRNGDETRSRYVNIEKWLADHPLKPGEKLKMEPIFQTARVLVLALTNKGQRIDLHYHTITSELVIRIKGQCAQYVHGKWVLMKPGDIHFRPRVLIHGIHPTGKEFKILAVFAPPQAAC